MKTPHEKLINQSPLRLGFLLIPLALAFFALSPAARAVDPPPDGGYPNQNTAEGEDALFSLTTGNDNTAIGFNALYTNTAGNFNTATGAGALFRNKAGNENTANGAGALFSNRGGDFNTAVGVDALYSNTYGVLNTAIGLDALASNTTGNGNTAIGVHSLEDNTTGNSNTAIGGGLPVNTTGSSNTANGGNALNTNTTGSQNTAVGNYALQSNNGDNNIAVGYQAGTNLTTGSNNIDIGARGHVGESNTIRIGQQGTQSTTLIAGISGATVPTGVAVIVDAGGHLGTTTSSARYKEAIKPMDQTSEAILGLKPVTFHYKSDSKGTPQFGLIAEEVARVNPDLVVRDENGEIYTVRYEAVNMMLLNEFLKAHRKMEQQEATIAKQQKQIEALTTGLQKVSAELELSKPELRTVLNNQ